MAEELRLHLDLQRALRHPVTRESPGVQVSGQRGVHRALNPVQLDRILGPTQLGQHASQTLGGVLVDRGLQRVPRIEAVLRGSRLDVARAQ